MAGFLNLTLLFAQNLKDKDWFSRQDPYCKVTCGGQTRRTKTIRGGGKNPVWNQTVQFNVLHENTVYIELWDEDPGFDDFIGRATLDLSTVKTSRRQHTTIPVISKSGKQRGTLTLDASFEPNAAAMPTAVKPTYGQPVHGAPVAGYPAGPTPGYPAHPPQGYPSARPQAAYAGAPPPGYPGAPPPGYPSAPAGYPPASHAYPPPPAGYPAPPPGYPSGSHGYGAVHQAPYRPPYRPNNGGNTALGVMGGLMGGLLLGDIIGDIF